MNKDFDSWNDEKKKVDMRTHGKTLFYHPRELWWCTFGLNIGVETDGKHHDFERPVLILRKFNREHFWGIPLTSNMKNDPYHQKIIQNSHMSQAMLTQIKSFSSKRLLRKMGKVSESDSLRIKERIKDLL